MTDDPTRLTAEVAAALGEDPDAWLMPDPLEQLRRCRACSL